MGVAKHSEHSFFGADSTGQLGKFHSIGWKHKALIVLSADCTLFTFWSVSSLLICMKADSHGGLPLADCRTNIYAGKFISLKPFAHNSFLACSFFFPSLSEIILKMHIKVSLLQSEVKGCYHSCHPTVTINCTSVFIHKSTWGKCKQKQWRGWTPWASNRDVDELLAVNLRPYYLAWTSITSP